MKLKNVLSAILVVSVCVYNAQAMEEELLSNAKDSGKSDEDSCDVQGGIHLHTGENSIVHYDSGKSVIIAWSYVSGASFVTTIVRKSVGDVVFFDISAVDSDNHVVDPVLPTVQALKRKIDGFEACLKFKADRIQSGPFGAFFDEELFLSD